MTSEFVSKSQWLHSCKDLLLVKTFVGMIRLTGWTSRSICLNPELIDSLPQNYILSTWHNNIYYSCFLLKNRKYGSMISSSRDGELIARVMEHFAFIPIRGSSSTGGSKALREMVKYLKGPLPAAITPDGPQGPKYKVQSGVIMIARMTGVPIVPWGYEALDQIVLRNSWDHHKIPKPFTIAVSSFGAPFYVPAKLSGDEMQGYCENLEQAMTDNQERITDEIERLKKAGAGRFPGKIRLMLGR
ncbi:MAG: lysophospholipid acyltransferase family protein [SAR324 cluster bacterium]|nr:lysophospholipid acyltransferase family protein [SAR324 cluster bacterium]